jgi:hypothetical protein
MFVTARKTRARKTYAAGTGLDNGPPSPWFPRSS